MLLHLACLQLAVLGVVQAGVVGDRVRSRSDTPAYPTDAGTSKYCDYWFDIDDAGMSCAQVPSLWSITLAQWTRWNPSLANKCSATDFLVVGQSYCVDALREPATSPTAGATLPATPAPTPTKPDNGITTPQPTQAELVDNCNKFVLVAKNQFCQQVANTAGITLEQFTKWNPSVGASCGGLWADAYACVGVIGFTSAPSPTPSPTKPANGVETPQPYLPGSSDQCAKFYFVPKNSGCQAAADANKISLANLYAWNPQVGTSCAGLWADTYICVQTIGFVAPPVTTTTPTTPSNGVATPSPLQPGVVSNCNVFTFVAPGKGCQEVADANKISLSNFYLWNTGVGSTCGGLYANAYACVSVIGYVPPKPSPTQPSNGVTTPQPVQPGMVANCKKFAFVTKGQGCADLANANKVSVANIIAWNSGAGASCTGLWAETYACVGI